MPVDRPRRALLEEPDDVESYVAKRSRGFTQADSGDRVAVRPVRAARALDPRSVGATQAPAPDRDHLGLSDPATPRRALPAEPLSLGPDQDESTPAEVGAAGRRAIVDLEPSHSSEPAPPSRLAQLLAEPDVAPEASAGAVRSCHYPSRCLSRRRSLRSRHLPSRRLSCRRSLRWRLTSRPRDRSGSAGHTDRSSGTTRSPDGADAPVPACSADRSSSSADGADAAIPA